MFGADARRLAVASLTEAGDATIALWRRDGRPLQGYVLVTGEGSDCRVTVYLQQGEGNPTAVLAGDMVWLQTPAEGAAEPHGASGAEPPRESGVGEPGTAGRAAKPEAAPPEEEPAEIGFKLYPEPATPVMAIPAHKIEVIVTPVDEGAGAGPGPVAEAEPSQGGVTTDAPAPSSATADADADAGAGADADADPDANPAPASTSADGAIALLSRHPLAPRARGSARISSAQGNLTIAVRGLPSPSRLGPTYNAYRAWLLNQRAGTRESLGLLTRAWGDNYHLETAGDLPLSHFDAIIVTAEDRRATIAHQNPPQVLFGSYR